MQSIFHDFGDSAKALVFIGVGGGALLLIALLKKLNNRRRRKYKKARRHDDSTLSHLQHRKEGLQSSIQQLKRQLEMREEQLRLHDQLEEVMTSRIDVHSDIDEEWDRILNKMESVPEKSLVTTAKAANLYNTKKADSHPMGALTYKNKVPAHRKEVPAGSDIVKPSRSCSSYMEPSYHEERNNPLAVLSNEQWISPRTVATPRGLSPRISLLFETADEDRYHDERSKIRLSSVKPLHIPRLNFTKLSH